MFMWSYSPFKNLFPNTEVLTNWHWHGPRIQFMAAVDLHVLRLARVLENLHMRGSGKQNTHGRLGKSDCRGFARPSRHASVDLAATQWITRPCHNASKPFFLLLNVSIYCEGLSRVTKKVLSKRGTQFYVLPEGRFYLHVPWISRKSKERTKTRSTQK